MFLLCSRWHGTIVLGGMEPWCHIAWCHTQINLRFGGWATKKNIYRTASDLDHLDNLFMDEDNICVAMICCARSVCSADQTVVTCARSFRLSDSLPEARHIGHAGNN